MNLKQNLKAVTSMVPKHFLIIIFRIFAFTIFHAYNYYIVYERILMYNLLYTFKTYYYLYNDPNTFILIKNITDIFQHIVHIQYFLYFIYFLHILHKMQRFIRKYIYEIFVYFIYTHISIYVPSIRLEIHITTPFSEHYF